MDKSEKSKLSGITKVHFCLLGVVIANFIIGVLSGYKINQNLMLILKIVLYISGLLLFVKAIKPFRTIAVYYFFYAMTVFAYGISHLFGGVFLAIILSFLLYPIYPPEIKYTDENLRIYTKYQGLMSACCAYDVTQPKFVFLEKSLGFVTINEPINFDNNPKFSIQKDTISYKYENKNAQDIVVKLQLQ